MKKIRLIKHCKALLLLIGISLFASSSFAQNVTLRGRVVDQKGEALIGATIQVVGTQNAGTTTDVNGNFSLIAAPGITALNVSYTGYVTLTVPVTNGATNLGNIVLANDANNLSDVVIVGYGTLRRQDVTGTVATVDAKVLQEIPATNVFEQLKGRVAGLDVVTGSNGLPSITIRGTEP